MSKLLQNKRIARVSTIPFFVFTQLRRQSESLVEAGGKVTVVASSDEFIDKMKLIKGCDFQPINIARQISPLTDLVTLTKLWKLFRKEKFDVVHSTTPKAGLLCAIAAKLAGVPVCIHTFTGQPWVTMSGIKKAIVRYCDKIIVRLNTCSYADSPSQRDFLLKNKIASPSKLKVIGSGSLAGVNTKRFNGENFTEAEKTEIKSSLGIDPSAKVLLFVGRITKEKGIFELIDAVQSVSNTGIDVVLMVVGPFEQYNEEEIRTYADEHCANKVKFIGFHPEPERFMAISDLLCLPSYREGFGTVVIEAAAMGLPVIGTNIYGLSDAVVDGETGVLIEPRNRIQLARGIEQLLFDDPLRLRLGEQAKKRALDDFDSDYCNSLLIQEYKKLLDNLNIG